MAPEADDDGLLTDYGRRADRDRQHRAHEGLHIHSRTKASTRHTVGCLRLFRTILVQNPCGGAFNFTQPPYSRAFTVKPSVRRHG